ncbi:hypothetical protein T12_5938 [Trichinella patagoniensis]|uniref:Uncharacterized protein n=1 Tax=Trichinella patagoniensis TaxID=990121 RepID=A0A0V0ZNC8_9BILA|nr:hypothetical protein T12_5938 [Trichinella patagoniensis]
MRKKITSCLNGLLIKIHCYSTSQQQICMGMDVWLLSENNAEVVCVVSAETEIVKNERNAVLDSDLCPGPRPKDAALINHATLTTPDNTKHPKLKKDVTMGFRPRLTISNEFTTETVDNHNARVRETGKRYPSRSCRTNTKTIGQKLRIHLIFFTKIVLYFCQLSTQFLCVHGFVEDQYHCIVLCSTLLGNLRVLQSNLAAPESH